LDTSECLSFHKSQETNLATLFFCRCHAYIPYTETEKTVMLWLHFTVTGAAHTLHVFQIWKSNLWWEKSQKDMYHFGDNNQSWIWVTSGWCSGSELNTFNHQIRTFFNVWPTRRTNLCLFFMPFEFMMVHSKFFKPPVAHSYSG
jgi:hypothetical protein